jgi:hypothetical protein
MEQDGWVSVYSTDMPYKAELIKQILFDEQIVSFILNQQDSTYLFGNIEICVKPGDVIRAKHILNNIDL